MLFSGEDGSVQFYELATGKLSFEFQTNSARVKAMKLCKVEDANILFTGSSDGLLKAWKVTETEVKTVSIVDLRTVVTKKLFSLFRASCPSKK